MEIRSLVRAATLTPVLMLGGLIAGPESSQVPPEIPASTEAAEVAEATPTPVPPDPTSELPFASWLPGFVPSELYRIMPGETPPEQRFADNYIDKFEVIGASVAVPSSVREKLVATLLTGSHFGELRKNRCKFRPGVALRGGEGGSRVDLLICFACDEIGIVPAGKALMAVYSFDQAARDVLLAVSKELLPNDEAVQSLPEVRREGVAPPPPAPPLPGPETTE